MTASKTISIPYSTVRKGKRYWQIGEARAKGSPVPAYEALGEDNFRAQQKALAYYDQWKAWRAGPARVEEDLGGYPPGSLGAFWTMWKQTDDFLVDKKERTREEYEWCWSKRIGPAFGATLVTRITVSDSEAFHRRMRKDLSPREAWSTLKIWRALLLVLEKKHILTRAPIGAVSNPMPIGRGQFWLERDVARMLRACRLLKADAMGLLIRLAWETAMAPPDCRTFSLDMLRQDRGGWFVERARTKTQKQARPPISEQLAKDLMAYKAALEQDGLELMPGTPLFRHTRGRVWTREYLASQFAIVRRVTFGKAEKRQFQDLRRSANLEADLGDASAADRAAVLANALDRNPALDAVYTPATVARGRKVQQAREAGRALLAQEVGRKAK